MNRIYSKMKIEMKKIYLDVCCLNRPFDDQEQDRIRIEADAVNILLKGIQQKRFFWIGSGAVIDELEMTPDGIKRNEMIALYGDVSEEVELTDEVIARAKMLHEFGFGAYDSLHIAFAEVGKVDVFFSTDDKLVKKASRMKHEIKISIANPATWLWEEPK